MSYVVVDVCYGPQGPEEADETFFGQLDEASCLQAVILMWSFSHPNHIPQSNAVGHKQSRRFLECVEVSGTGDRGAD